MTTGKTVSWEREGSLREKIIRMWRSIDEKNISSDPELWEGMAPRSIRHMQDDEEDGRRSNERADLIAGYLRDRGLLQKEHTILDAGCGTGRISAEFAKTAGHVTGVDISPSYCMEARRRAASQGLDNVDIITADLSSFDPVKEGAAKEYDLVFANLLPAAMEYETFRKLTELSRGYCFVSFLVGFRAPQFQELAAGAVGNGLGEPKSRILKFQMAFNILCMEGMRPEVTYYEVDQPKSITADDHAVTYIRKMWPSHDFTAEEEERILEMFREKADKDGTVTSDVSIVCGCLLWKVKDGGIHS